MRIFDYTEGVGRFCIRTVERSSESFVSLAVGGRSSSRSRNSELCTYQ